MIISGPQPQADSINIPLFLPLLVTAESQACPFIPGIPGLLAL